MRQATTRIAHKIGERRRKFEKVANLYRCGLIKGWAEIILDLAIYSSSLRPIYHRERQLIAWCAPSPAHTGRVDSCASLSSYH